MIAALERVQPPDRVQRVLVDGVHVVDVVLHAPRRRLPLGHDRGEDAEVLHLFQARRVGAIARVAADLDEASARLHVLAQQPRLRRGQLAELSRVRRASGTSRSMASWKMRIISDGLRSKILGSIGSSAPSRTTKSRRPSCRPAGPEHITGWVFRRFSSRTERAGAAVRSRCESAWRARGTGASAPPPPGGRPDG